MNKTRLDKGTKEGDKVTFFANNIGREVTGTVQRTWLSWRARLALVKRDIDGLEFFVHVNQ